MLHRDLAVELLVVGAVHHAHRPATDLPQHRVRPDPKRLPGPLAVRGFRRPLDRLTIGTDKTWFKPVCTRPPSQVTNQGRALLFIYGENDPYTAAAFELGAAEDSHRFIVPGDNHGARILELDPGPRDQALAALAVWSGVDPMIR